MSKRREPDNVDLFISGAEPDAKTDRETAQFIKEYKKRPGYPAEVKEAKRILASLGIHPSDHGTSNAAALLDHRSARVADLTKPAAETRPRPAKTKKK